MEYLTPVYSEVSSFISQHDYQKMFSVFVFLLHQLIHARHLI